MELIQKAHSNLCLNHIAPDAQSLFFKTFKLHPQDFTKVKVASLVFQEQGSAVLWLEVVGVGFQ